jgi:hypothetical protein
MEFKKIHAKMSKPQMAKMKKGVAVRIKPAIEGEGVCLMVNPANYSQITRSFSRNKGSEIRLTPEELAVNASEGSKMEGSGLYSKGKKAVSAVDKSLDKQLGKPVKKALIASAISSVAPELAPVVLASQTPIVKKAVKRVAKKVGMGIKPRLPPNSEDVDMSGYGIYAAAPSRVGRGLRVNPKLRRSLVGFGMEGCAPTRVEHSRFVSVLPPALQSQPYAANFAMANQLPVQFQSYARGSVAGAGLYAAY